MPVANQMDSLEFIADSTQLGQLKLGAPCLSSQEFITVHESWGFKPFQVSFTVGKSEYSSNCQQNHFLLFFFPGHYLYEKLIRVCSTVQEEIKTICLSIFLYVSFCQNTTYVSNFSQSSDQKHQVVLGLAVNINGTKPLVTTTKYMYMTLQTC